MTPNTGGPSIVIPNSGIGGKLPTTDTMIPAGTSAEFASSSTGPGTSRPGAAPIAAVPISRLIRLFRRATPRHRRTDGPPGR